MCSERHSQIFWLHLWTCFCLLGWYNRKRALFLHKKILCLCEIILFICNEMNFSNVFAALLNPVLPSALVYPQKRPVSLQSALSFRKRDQYLSAKGTLPSATKTYTPSLKIFHVYEVFNTPSLKIFHMCKKYFIHLHCSLKIFHMCTKYFIHLLWKYFEMCYRMSEPVIALCSGMCRKRALSLHQKKSPISPNNSPMYTQRKTIFQCVAADFYESSEDQDYL